MKRVITIIVAILVCTYFITGYFENRAKKQAEKLKTEQKEKTLKTAVMQLVTNTNAVCSWEKDLCKGERFRLEPILTIELEQLWLVNRPILFIGSVEDISTSDQEQYWIKIERNMLVSQDYNMFGSKLQLMLQCPKQKIDSFLKEHPELFKNSGFNNGVAVVAVIDKIETVKESNFEGESEEVKIGKGKCVDIIYTGLTHINNLSE
jgi:hypothetical protein